MIRALLVILLAGTVALAGGTGFEPPVPPKPFFTGNNAHKYLGYTTLAAAALSGLAPKEEGGLHEYAGYTAGALAIASVATGTLYHHDDIHPALGFKDPDNMHALLGAGGALLMGAGLASAPDGSHASPAMAGAGLMLLSFYYIW
jgi:hypothetical protein